jgi:TonB-dependent receptor
VGKTLANSNFGSAGLLKGRSNRLLASASIAAMCGMLVAFPAAAQTAADKPAAEDEIIVTGIRASLANSQTIKKNSDTIVDAITAEDIGALPDRSVTEALQRVPGVVINRFAGSNDPDHFSIEGSGVVIRGLNFVRAEFNGRDAFSANGGRSLGFADVPAELLGSVVVAKNLTAEMIEGGLAGTVNLNTRLPFDQKGFTVGLTAEANYSDFAKRWTPQGSALVSNIWETGIGRIGFLAAASYSQVFSRSDGIQITNFQTRDGAIVQGSSAVGGPIARAKLPGKDLAYAPLGGQFRSQNYDRERMGLAAAAQWESLDGRAKASLQYFRAESSTEWSEHTFETGSDLSEYNTFPRTGTNYTYNADNVFEGGYVTLPGTGWRTGDSGSPNTRVPTGGSQISLARRDVFQETTNQDIGFNFKFDADDHWSFNADAQYTSASTDNLDVSVFGSTFADSELDLTGAIPTVTPHKPVTTRADWAAPNPALEGATDAQYFGSKNYTFYRAAMDHAENSTGKEVAFKGDVQYSFDKGGFLKRFKLGARYSDRDQTVRSSVYNWGVLSEVWAGNNGSAVFFDEFGSDRTAPYTFDNFFRGATKAPPVANYYAGNLIQAYSGASTFFKSVNDYWRSGQTDPATSQGRGWVPLAERNGVVAGTRYLPSEVQQASEKTKAAYAMLSFGNDDYADGLKISGNIGVRFVETELVSDGSIQFPQASAVSNGQTFAQYCQIPLPPGGTRPVICNLSPTAFAAAAQFANGAFVPDVARNKYTNWLPSLNLKFGLSDDVILRFAASRTLARPNFGYVRNFLTINGSTGNGFRFAAEAGNPALRPATADQLDLSAEWYFSRVGSITATAFYKSVSNFFYDAVTTRSFTNNGVTQNVDVRGPANYTKEKGQVKGFELSYQQTYDFLPSFLSGLGFQGNYTYIDSKGIPNALLDTSNASTVTPGNLPLEQLSKHNFNATLFYDRGPVSMRASYSWRSRFLLTARDVIFPYFPIYNESTGQLDASFFFNITKNVKLAIQGTNLLNEVTKTSQQFTPGGLSGPRSYFVNDRRYTFGVRASF